jgi:meromycolic acid enoyl-[acyl-carrier protein] reductase
VARKLPMAAPLVELDITDPDHLARLPGLVGEHVDGIDGVMHSIAFAPPSCLGGGFLEAPWEDVATALHVSAFSLKSLAVATRPLFGPDGGSLVGLTFDARVAWPAYDWMGVAKAGLESTARYLARELGPKRIRVNLVAAGPIRTMAAKSIPGFSEFENAWNGRAPLGWDNTDAEPVARTCVALLSDWLPTTSGEMVHADGGFHAMGV